MSDIFKLKVCIGNANIELEGEGNLVHTIFSELREDGLGKLSDSVPVEIKNDVSDREIGNNILCEEKNNIEIKEPQIKETSKLPQINTIVIKNLPKTETEWIVVYALYVSEQGTKIFNKEDLRQLYQDSGRLDENRNKNFSTNIKKAIAADWFEIVNNDTYSLSETGKGIAYEIIQRTASSDGGKKARKLISSSKTAYTIVDLGLEEEQRQEFKQYLLSFKGINNMEHVVLIAYKLTQYGVAEFNGDIIFTALRIADLPTSFDLKAALNNAKNLKNYFVSGKEAGMYKLYHLGEDHAKELEKGRGAA